MSSPSFSLVPAVVLVVSAVAGSAPVEAKCRAPGAFFSPGPGTRLPRDPVVYFFSPRFRGTPDITARGSGVRSVQVRRVSSSGAHDVYRVAVRHAPGGGDRGGRVILAVRQNGGSAVRASYAIDAGWRPPAIPLVEIRRTTVRSSAWTCSHESTHSLRPSVDAAAYRVEWAASREAYLEGRVQQVIVPRNREGYFDPPSVPGPTEIVLGHLNCVGHTLRWSGPAVYLGVRALFADGSAGPRMRDPHFLERPPHASRR